MNEGRPGGRFRQDRKTPDRGPRLRCRRCVEPVHCLVHISTAAKIGVGIGARSTPFLQTRYPSAPFCRRPSTVERGRPACPQERPPIVRPPPLPETPGKTIGGASPRPVHSDRPAPARPGIGLDSPTSRSDAFRSARSRWAMALPSGVGLRGWPCCVGDRSTRTMATDVGRNETDHVPRSVRGPPGSTRCRPVGGSMILPIPVLISTSATCWPKAVSLRSGRRVSAGSGNLDPESTEGTAIAGAGAA